MKWVRDWVQALTVTEHPRCYISLHRRLSGCLLRERSAAGRLDKGLHVSNTLFLCSEDNPKSVMNVYELPTRELKSASVW